MNTIHFCIFKDSEFQDVTIRYYDTMFTKSVDIENPLLETTILYPSLMATDLMQLIPNLQVRFITGDDRDL